ncbi:MAG: formate/nitrite transporter family protein [Lachnospiraceae bacterium]|nr:formate/nitrite transporter family protein [Lachnospiraceae bacterium]
MSSFYTPEEVMELNMHSSQKKVNRSLGKMILLGIMAGMFIALGGAASNTAVYGIENTGLARAVAGLIFPAGLIMTVFLGGELFTGNCLIAMSVCAKRVTFGKMMRNLAVVYFSNLIGALLVDVLVFYSGNLGYSDGLLGAYTIKVAVGKTAIEPLTGVISGMLCNILVCVAILMATAAKDAIGKIGAIFVPIAAFVTCGFEHCVANMYYIPLGILATKNVQYVEKAKEVYGITKAQLDQLTVTGSLGNLIPVTIGNIIGGMLVVGGLFFFSYKSEAGRKPEETTVIKQRCEKQAG